MPSKAYWNDGLLLKIIPRLTSQLSIFPDLVSSASSPLTTTLSSLSGSTTSESVLKLLNERLCMFTRDDSPRVRIAALKAMDAVWEKQAEEMIALVPETVSEFLAELLEDENGEVEGEARKVLARIEKMTGSLKEYLE
jgi:U3 small nucleolar RNA-associated protein 10